MKRTIILIFFTACCFGNSFCQFSPGYYALKDVSVIDGISKNVLSHYTIIIRNKYIEAVGPEREITIPDSAMISNWNSRNILPAYLKAGLTDSFWDSVFRSLPVTDLIKAMQKNKTILDATILTFKEAGSDASLPDNRRLAWFAMYEIGKRFTILARENGIPICAGTDLDEKKFVQREIKLLVKECDFTPMNALISATAIGARAIGIEKTTGTIQAGKIANLVLPSTDPSLEIDNLDKVVLVIKNGKLYNF